jgi:hypothetical protein
MEKKMYKKILEEKIKDILSDYYIVADENKKLSKQIYLLQQKVKKLKNKEIEPECLKTNAKTVKQN